MSDTKEIRRRINSIQNTSKITKTMELISTIKMKKSQDLALEKKEYIRWVLDVFLKLSESMQDSMFFRKPVSWKTLAVLIASNKWLCGWYNINVMKKVNDYIKKYPDEEIDFVTLWKKWTQFVGKTWNNIVADFSNDFTDNVTYTFSKPISKYLTKMYLDWYYSKIIIFYNYYVNTIKQIPVSIRFLPLTQKSIDNYFKEIFGDDYEKERWTFTTTQLNYTIEPSRDELLKHIMPLILDSMFYDLLLESKASEHSARMIAMKNAKENADNYSSDLTLKYNKARQAAITTEVGEIVSGVEAMKD